MDAHNFLLILSYDYSGTRIKTRKRNIAAPLDPAAFADAVVQIYLDNAGDLVIWIFNFDRHLYTSFFVHSITFNAIMTW